MQPAPVLWGQTRQFIQHCPFAGPDHACPLTCTHVLCLVGRGVSIACGRQGLDQLGLHVGPRRTCDAMNNMVRGFYAALGLVTLLRDMPLCVSSVSMGSWPKRSSTALWSNEPTKCQTDCTRYGVVSYEVCAVFPSVSSPLNGATSWWGRAGALDSTVCAEVSHRRPLRKGRSLSCRMNLGRRNSPQRKSHGPLASTQTQAALPKARPPRCRTSSGGRRRRTRAHLLHILAVHADAPILAQHAVEVDALHELKSSRNAWPNAL